MSYKHINYGNLKTFADELKSKYAKKSELEQALTGVKVNGALLAVTDRVAELLVAEGSANGTVAVNNVDVAVHGLAALAYKSQVSEDDLAAALKAAIDAKAKQSDLDALTGSGEGSISKMIDDAFNDFSTKVSDDGVVNSYKELIDWAAEHGSQATELAAGIQENKTTVGNLKTLVGALPEGASSATVVDYIAEAIAALSIGDYAKTVEVTAAISDALKNYYTKTEMDSTFIKQADADATFVKQVDADAAFVKQADIETVTEDEIKALLADV